MMESDPPRQRDESFVRRFANEIGTRFRRYQDEGDAALPAELRLLLDQLDRTERGPAEPSS